MRNRIVALGSVSDSFVVEAVRLRDRDGMHAAEPRRQRIPGAEEVPVADPVREVDRGVDDRHHCLVLHRDLVDPGAVGGAVSIHGDIAPGSLEPAQPGLRSLDAWHRPEQVPGVEPRPEAGSPGGRGSDVLDLLATGD